MAGKEYVQLGFDGELAPSTQEAVLQLSFPSEFLIQAENENELPRINLVKTPAMQDLVGYIARSSIHTRRVSNKFDQYIQNAHMKPSLLTTFNILSELHVQHLFETYYKNRHEEQSNIPDSFESERFRVRKRTKGGNYIADIRNRDRGNWESVTDYDILTVIEGKPFVIEVKGGRDRQVGKSLYRAIDLKNIPRRLGALREMFGTSEIGYAVIVMPELFNPNDQRQKDFVEAGGIIIPFKTSYNDFWDFAVKVQDEVVYKTLAKGPSSA